MVLLVFEIGLILLLAAAGVVAVARRLGADRKRVALTAELAVALHADLRGGVLSFDHQGHRLTAAFSEPAGLSDTLVISIPLDEDPETMEPQGYRAPPRARRSARPWFAFRRAALWSRLAAATRAGSLVEVGRETLYVESDLPRGEVKRILADPDLAAMLKMFLDSGADRVEVDAAAVRVFLGRVRPEQLYALAFRALAQGLATVAAALPDHGGRARPRAPLDARSALLAAALALGTTAPFFASASLDDWPPFDPSYALLLGGAGLGVIGWLVALLVVYRLFGARDPGRQRAVFALVALAVGLPLDGLGIAVTLNARLGAPWIFTAHGPVSRVASRFGRDHYEVVTPDATRGVGSGRARVGAGWIDRENLRRCPEHAIVGIGRGALGFPWLDQLFCPDQRSRERRPRQPLRAPFGIEHVGYLYGERPWMTHYFDVRLRNDKDETRWFVLSTYVDETMGAPSGATSIQAVALAGTGRVPVVTLVGAGLQAVLLPPHADVTIEGLAMQAVEGALPQKHGVRVAITHHLRWDDHDVKELFVESLLASPAAFVVDCRDRSRCEELHVHGPGRAVDPRPVFASDMDSDMESLSEVVTLAR